MRADQPQPRQRTALFLGAHPDDIELGCGPRHDCPPAARGTWYRRDRVPSREVKPTWISFGGTAATVTSMGLIFGLDAAASAHQTIVSAAGLEPAYAGLKSSP